MKKSISTIGLILASSLLLIIILVGIVQVSNRTRQLTKDNGIYELEKISGDFEDTIADAEMLTLETAIGAREFLLSRSSLEKYIYEQRDRLVALDKDVINVYIAGEGWHIIPDFDESSGYVPTKRVWYLGAVKNGGEPYVSAPYTDAITGQICYSVSVALWDADTVVCIDYSADRIQNHISQMYGSASHDAVIVTDEGVIAGCSNPALVGTTLASSLPEYVGIWSLSKDSDGVANTRIKDGIFYENLFAAKSGNGWYLIISMNDWDLYKESYMEVAGIILMSIALFIAMALLYVSTHKRRRVAERTLASKEEFLEKWMEKIRAPLSIITNTSTSGNIENADDFHHEMERIRIAGESLSETFDALTSYSEIKKADRKNSSEKKKFFDPASFGVGKRYRTVIIMFMIVVLVLGLSVNIRANKQWANERMQGLLQGYEYELAQWKAAQKSILDMFVSEISTNPKMLFNYDETIRFLNDITVQYPEISATYLANPQLMPSVYMNNGWKPEPGWHVEERAWYKDTLASDEGWSMSAPYYDERTGSYCITMSEKVYDSSNGKFLGVFGIDFYMDKLIEILGGSYSEEGYAFLVDPSGNIINHPYGTYQMTAESSTNIFGLPYSEVQPNGVDTKIIRDYDGEQKILLASNNRSSGFSIYVVNDFRSIYGKLMLYLVFFGVIFIVCIYLTYKLLTAMIRWQDNATAKMKEASDAAIAAGQAKGQFLAQMSHEIRTPINAILGMNEMISRESGEDNVLDYSDKIQMAGKNLLSLINDILDFSRIEDGKMEIIPVKYSLSSMLVSLETSISERAKDKGLDLIMSINENTPSELWGDEVRIKQAVMNILTNAVKYTEKGSVALIVDYEDDTNDANYINLSISVRDTGIGIKSEDMDRLFSKFERIDEKRNRNIEGTGLGMSITKSILEMMGSELTVDSVYGSGSEFSFILKQKVISRDPVGDYKKAYEDRAKKNRGYSEKFTAPDARVLVVDDNAVNLLVFSGLLKKTLIRIDTADNADDALALTRENHYDIIFLDHMMPNKDGIEALHELREDADNINRNAPAVCLTANAVTGAREEYIKEGFNDYLSKPIDSEKLESMLMEFLNINDDQSKL